MLSPGLVASIRWWCISTVRISLRLASARCVSGVGGNEDHILTTVHQTFSTRRDGRQNVAHALILVDARDRAAHHGIGASVIRLGGWAKSLSTVIRVILMVVPLPALTSTPDHHFTLSDSRRLLEVVVSHPARDRDD
jgi:hypothetical protein